MAKETKNYTLGRGKLFFARFLPNTKIPDAFLYFGNTPEFNLTIESEDLDHFSSDEGVREKDDGVTLEVTRSGSLITDNISPDNIALFFFGTASVVAVASATGSTWTLTNLKKGYDYLVGATLLNPTGVKGIDPSDFVVGTAGGVKASGSATFAGLPTADDTITIAGVAYTFKAGAVAGANEILIGADAAATAANLAAAIIAGPGIGATYGTGTVANPDVTATAAAGVLTILAKVAGTGGNAITLAEDADNVTISGATLTGGSGTPAEFVLDTDYKMNFDTGRLTILEAGSMVEGDDLDITYSVRASTRDRVMSGNKAVEGALMYEANNPKGKNFDYYMGYVSISPNGDHALKGDEWQQIPFNLQILKPDNTAAILCDGRPVYA